MWESPAFGDFQGLVGAEENLLLVSLRVHSPSFPPPFFMSPYALRFARKPANNLRLAACISSAAAVSLLRRARCSNSVAVSSGRSHCAKPGSWRRISQGVAYQP